MRIIRAGGGRDTLALYETLFHTANGYIGVRASPEEGAPAGVKSVRGAYINAFYDTGDIAYGEKLHGFATQRQTMLNVPDVQGVRLTLAGERFAPFAGAAHDYTYELDMARGVFTRALTWVSPGGRATRIVFERMASLAQKELFLLRAAATPLNWSGEVCVESTQSGDVYNDFDAADPRKLAEAEKMLLCESAFVRDGVMLMRCRASRSGQSMASAVGHVFPAGFAAEFTSAGDINTALITGFVPAGQSAGIAKYCVFTDSRRCADPLDAALALLKECMQRPFAGWEQRQREALDAFWARAEASVRGDEALNQSLHYCAYALLQSCGRDGISNIPSKGLSGEGYEGHYFWDTEIYMFPFFLLTDPPAARALLDYRHAILPEARRQARLLGHKKGALYAWRTIGGAECSGYFPSGSAQYHINADVAHAFLDYYYAARDLDYMADKGAEVLLETARLWLDVGHYGDDGRFYIDCVTGPDEYSCLVNNNFYTNRAAQYHLLGAQSVCAALEGAGKMDAVRARTGITNDELHDFVRAAQSMYLPFDEKLGIRAQDDAFLQKERIDLTALPREDFPLLTHYHPLWLYRRQVCKQADAVLAHFLYEAGESESAIRRTYDYYERVTTHDSSLSECVFSMMAARVGDTDKAYDYYIRSACLDLMDTHGNTRDGIHAANMGGAWMGVAFGFGGLRIGLDGPRLRPCLPKQWTGYAFRFCWHGSRAEAEVSSAGLRLTLLSGAPLALFVYGERCTLENSLCVPLRAL